MDNKLVPSSSNFIDILDLNLKPYRIMDLFDGKIIYEFWRVSQNKNSKYKNTPTTKDCAKEMAMIVLDKRANMFKVHYYPLNGEIQVIEELKIEKLYEAIKNLQDAGF